MRATTWSAIGVIVVVMAVLAGVLGYCWNIVRFLEADCDRETKLCVVRGIGVFVPPVGAVMGYIPNSEALL